LTQLPDEGPARVLVDTDVFTEVYIKHATEPRGTAWTQVLTGRTVVIAVQTEVELRAWPQLFGWNDKRTHALIERVEAVPRIQVADVAQRHYVGLTAWAKHNGHAIHQKVHTADRWVAATALAYGFDLATIDGIYDGIAGLSLLKPPP
jgi:predicted nucleic acid-binding protein